MSASGLMTEDDRLLRALLGSEPPGGDQSPAAGEWGYSIRRGSQAGRALLHTRTGGAELVKRLKDAEGALTAETAFWCSLLARLARDSGLAFDVVTHPPSSGKREHHLATQMAGMVATELGLPTESRFRNLAPRGHRASMAAKLLETGGYAYDATPAGATVLLVDDLYCTGRTVARCAEVARGDRLWALTLSRS